MHTPAHKPTNIAPKPKPKKDDTKFPDRPEYPNQPEDKHFPDQRLAPSPDEGYRGVRKLAKGGFVRAADGVAKRGKTKGRLI